MERSSKAIGVTRQEIEQAGAKYLHAKSLEYMHDPEKAKEYATTTAYTKEGEPYEVINTGLLNHLDHMSKRLADGAEKLERGKLNRDETPALQVLNVNAMEGRSLESIQSMSLRELTQQKPSQL